MMLRTGSLNLARSIDLDHNFSGFCACAVGSGVILIADLIFVVIAWAAVAGAGDVDFHFAILPTLASW